MTQYMILHRMTARILLIAFWIAPQLYAADSFFGLNGVGFFHYRDQPDAAIPLIREFVVS